MLIDTINAEDGEKMTAFEVDPANMPRYGDLIDMGETDGGTKLAVWRVDGVVWTEHPMQLKPTAIRLVAVERRGVTITQT